MQGLCATKNSGECLVGGTHDVIVWLLGGQCRTGRLCMETQHHGTRVLRIEALTHDMRPHPPRGAELGNLFKQVVMAIKEERKLAREAIHVQSCINGCLYISDRISQREGHF